ncbi:tRNA dihydrouridine synthase DusB [bacterium]|nr:tRNA dihydrouridine synthase DusB [bacterium]
MKKTLTIGNIQVPNQLILAPMAGYTDSPYRRCCKKFGVGLLYSEVISSLGLVFGNKKTFEMMKFHPDEHPISLQLFGNSPDKMAEAAKAGEQFGFDLIDLNLGCPAPKIVKNGAGGELLKDPMKLPELFRTVVQAVSIPVTIKMRVGYQPEANVVREVAIMAEEAGIQAIAIHGSTVIQNSLGSRQWGPIREAKESVSIPILANGGIKKPSDILTLLEETKADGVMIGRAALGRPWFFRDCLAILEGQDPYKIDHHAIDTNEMFAVIQQQIEWMLECKGEVTTIREMRTHLHHYLKGFPESSQVKDKINKTKNLEELRNILRTYKNTFFAL